MTKLSNTELEFTTRETINGEWRKQEILYWDGDVTLTAPGGRDGAQTLIYEATSTGISTLLLSTEKGPQAPGPAAILLKYGK